MPLVSGLVVRTIIVASATLLMSACSGGPEGGQIASTGVAALVPGDVLPIPDKTDLVISNRPYLVGPFDKLEIDVFGIEGMEKREISADAAGDISFPLAGVIDASGLTLRELEAAVARRLREKGVRDPQVTANLKELVGQMVTVDGEVVQPGVYPLLGSMTLSKAIATARGVDEFAKLQDVVVLRTAGGKRYAALYNLAAIRRGNYPDPQIYADDTIIVGESRARRLFKDLLQVAPLLTTPLIIAFR